MCRTYLPLAPQPDEGMLGGFLQGFVLGVARAVHASVSSCHFFGRGLRYWFGGVFLHVNEVCGAGFSHLVLWSEGIVVSTI